MKEHKTDQIFRQKLHQHSISPTPAAWDKVAAGLNHRRRKRGGYYAAAAAVVLLLSAGWLWLSQQPDPLNLPQTNTVAVQETPALQDQPIANIPADAEPTNQAAASQAVSPEVSATDITATASEQVAIATADKPADNASEQVQKAAAVKEAAVEKLPLAPEATLAKAEPVAPEVAPAGVQPEAIAQAAVENFLARTEPIVIRYDAATTATATSQTAVVAETIAHEEEQGPEKVLSILQKVKQGEIGLADIRQAKDKFLSGRFNKP